MAGLEDPLTTAKLAFFNYLSSLLELYLRNIKRTNLWFLSYQDLKSLIKSLLKLIRKALVVEKCKSGAQMVELDHSGWSILLDEKKYIGMSFAVEEILQKLIQKI